MFFKKKLLTIFMIFVISAVFFGCVETKKVSPLTTKQINDFTPAQKNALKEGIYDSTDLLKLFSAKIKKVDLGSGFILNVDANRFRRSKKFKSVVFSDTYNEGNFSLWQSSHKKSKEDVIKGLNWYVGKNFYSTKVLSEKEGCFLENFPEKKVEVLELKFIINGYTRYMTVCWTKFQDKYFYCAIYNVGLEARGGIKYPLAMICNGLAPEKKEGA